MIARLTAGLAGVWVALAAGAAEPELLTPIADPGPDRPVAGASLAQAVFPDGIPYPFEAALAHLRDLAGPENVETALIPLGRSLQRFAAAPDYFASPRIVVAVTGDESAGPNDLRLADRLFVGFQPAAEVVELISHNPAAGRFEFQEVVGYGPDMRRPIEYAERRVCAACHQGHAPVFARPLWSETNANPQVVQHLRVPGSDFYGVPLVSDVDAMQAFDDATDRAARLILSDRLWAEGCADAACRAELLIAALRLGLSGGAPDQAIKEFEETSAKLWPGGLAIISPDLANHDPVAAYGDGPLDAYGDAPGLQNPESPRDTLRVWVPGADALPTAVRAIAARFSAGDFRWLDEMLSARGAVPMAVTIPCRIRDAEQERRFDCASPFSRWSGFVGAGGHGRLERVKVGMSSRNPRLVLSEAGAGVYDAATGAGHTARLDDGRRIARIALGDESATLLLTQDFAPLARALRDRAANGRAEFAAEPFDRQGLLRLIREILEMEHG